MKRFRSRLHNIVFEAETTAGKLFDIFLFSMIIGSIFVVVLDSVKSFHEAWGEVFVTLEWGFTFFFATEYAVRIWTSKKPVSYIFSFYGLVDLLAILPTPIAYFYGGAPSMLVIRSLRLLRIFRVLKLFKFTGQQDVIFSALRSGWRKILVFVFALLTLNLVIGSFMYIVEGEGSGFTSIPRGMYWAIVTMTTVGYGDIAPTTVVGQMFASIVMIMGYGIIAVPTGIVSATVTQSRQNSQRNTRHCSSCNHVGHSPNALFCHACGEKLHRNSIQ